MSWILWKISHKSFQVLNIFLYIALMYLIKCLNNKVARIKVVITWRVLTSICFNFFILFLFWLCWALATACRPPANCREQGSVVRMGRAVPFVAYGLLDTRDSAPTAYRPSCPVAYGILLDQGSNLCPLQWQANSQPVVHQESSALIF